MHRLQRKKKKAQVCGNKKTSWKDSASEGTLGIRYRSPWDLYCILLDVYVAQELKTLFYNWSFRFFSSGKYCANVIGYLRIINLSNVNATLQETKLQGHKLKIVLNLLFWK